MPQDTSALLRALKIQLRQAAKPPAPAPKAVAPPDDATLFRLAVKDVIPLQPRRVLHPRLLPKPFPRQRMKDEARVMHDAMSDSWPWDEIETGEELLYLRTGQKQETLKRLRRGHWVVQAQLDLHGLTTDEARAAVGSFLHACVRADKRCVRIIHGKGLGSKNREPVLKNKLRNWLVQRDEVLAYSQARAVDGGSGAVLVLLRGARG